MNKKVFFMEVKALNFNLKGIITGIRADHGPVVAADIFLMIYNLNYSDDRGPRYLHRLP